MARLKMIIRDDSVEDIVAAPFEGHMVVVPGRLRSDLQMDRLGIKVTNVDDGKLTFGEACGRCAGVIVSVICDMVVLLSQKKFTM